MSQDRWGKSSIVPTRRQEYDEISQSFEDKMAEIQQEQQYDVEETKWVRRHLLLVEKRRVINMISQSIGGTDASPVQAQAEACSYHKLIFDCNSV